MQVSDWRGSTVPGKTYQPSCIKGVWPSKAWVKKDVKSNVVAMKS